MIVSNAFAALLANSRFIVLDGGMWRMLQGMGLGNDPPELWNLVQPEKVEAVHRAYVEAGARILYTNTIGGNRTRLERAGMGGQLDELNRAAVRAARTAADGRALVAGDVGPIGELLEPYGAVTAAAAEAIFREQARALAGEGVDLFVVETMMDLAEACAALRGIRAVSDLPVVCTMSFGAGGRTAMGDTPEEAARELAALGAAAVGANCSSGASGMIPVIRAMARAAVVPLVAKPNAGVPELMGERTVFPDTPAAMAEGARGLAEAGARLLGGCCGSTPDHIRAIGAMLDTM